MSQGFEKQLEAMPRRAAAASAAAGADHATVFIPAATRPCAPSFTASCPCGEAENVENFWFDQFQQSATLLDLPTDRPRPATREFKGATYRTRIGSDAYEAIQQLVARQKCTLFVTLLSAFQILLSRLSGQDDIIVGVPVAAESPLENTVLVEPPVNFIPLRGRTSQASSAAEFLAHMKQTVQAACEHRNYSCGRLIKKLQISTDPSRLPLTEVQFNLIQVGGDMTVEGFAANTDPNLENLADFDIFLNIVESKQKDGLTLDCRYNNGLLDEPTIARWMSHYETLLLGIAEDANQPLARLPLLTEAGHTQLVVDCNQTAADYSRHVCVHELFEAQARKIPDAIAAVFGSEQLTYRNLDRRANQLANYLRTTGVKPGVSVGVFVERSLDMIVALLGVMKAGGAYIPMDPTYPAERISFALNDAGVSILLTQESLKSVNIGAARQILVDTEWPAIAQHSSDAPQIATTTPTAEDLAYVIYTSGSTGEPKGVEIPHRAVVNLLLSMSKKPGLQASDTLLAVTTLSFDIAGLELFLPLACGAKLVVASHEIAADGNRLLSLIASSGATVMQATPVTWKLLIEAGWEGKPVLKVLCGGEALPRNLANALVRRSQAVWNMYGPTETTIWSSILAVKAGDGPVAIGAPIDNTQFYILDAVRQLVPIGVAGELYIGGDGLARGYVRRPQLTAEKFVTNPFWPEISSSRSSSAGSNACSKRAPRMYKTGDLVRRVTDGSIEFLGRLDHQVKLRGFRIELGEIEAALARYPGVREAVVVLREDIAGEKRLVGYVTSRQQAITVSAVREALAGRLPNYMLPSAIVRLEAMPLTPNGKIDRKALPAPESARDAHRQEFADPRAGQETMPAMIGADTSGIRRDAIESHNDELSNATHIPLARAIQEAESSHAANPNEKRLQKIWERLLDTSPIGVNQNYFELGGTSILAVRLFAEIAKEFHRKLPLSLLFEAQTIARLAKALEDEGSSSDWSPLVAIQPSGSRPPFFCIHGDGGNVLIYRDLSRHLGSDQPFYGLQAQGLDGVRPALTSIEAMASLYVNEIRRIQPHGPYHLGGYCMGGTVAYEIAQQLKEQNEQVALLALFDTMNWSHIPPETTWTTIQHLGQKISFHGKNFLLLDAREKKRFFTEKVKVLRSRTTIWKGRTFGRLLAKESGTKPESVLLAEMWLTNERAAVSYQAKPYKGVITDFRPMRQYAKYAAAKDDWSRLARGGHQIITLPVYPAGMLQEPFVKYLADALQTVISRKIR